MLEMETHQVGEATGRIIRHVTHWNDPSLGYGDDISLPVMAEGNTLAPTHIMFDLSGVSRIIPRDEIPDIGYAIFECDIDSINEYRSTYFGNNEFTYTYDGTDYEYLSRKLFDCVKVVGPGVRGIIVRDRETRQFIEEVRGDPAELKYMRVSQAMSEIEEITGGANALFKVHNPSLYRVGAKVWLDDIIDEGEVFNR
jgi:hypothetical protein